MQCVSHENVAAGLAGTGRLVGNLLDRTVKPSASMSKLLVWVRIRAIVWF